MALILEGMDARDALALDGEGSAQLYIAGYSQNIRGCDPVPVAPGVFARLSR